MKIARLILFSTLLFASTLSADVLEEGAGIVYGSDHSFSLKAPKGWMLDNESAVDQGVHAVFYPKGMNWKTSPIVAYAQSRPKSDGITTADDVAKSVVADFHAAGNPNYQGKHIKTLKTDGGQEIVIYHFKGDQWGNSEAVAYFTEEKTINFVVLNSRDPKLFADSLEAFETLIRSYVFLSDRPVIKENPGPGVR
jgi:hypothetical protein